MQLDGCSLMLLPSFLWAMHSWEVTRVQVVNVWDLRDYSHRTTVPVYEAIETVCVLPDGSGFPGSASSDGSLTANSMKPKKKSGGASLRFLTVGEHGIVQVWNSDG